MPLLDIDGGTRRSLVTARILAMKNGCSAGLAVLTAVQTNSLAAQIAINVERCELLYLDRRPSEAAEMFDNEISGLLEQVSPEQASLLFDNRSTISQLTVTANDADRFYHEVDVRRILGLEIRDASTELEARRDSLAGKHHESLPAVWKLLLDAYWSQNWRAMHWAHNSMSAECMALGWPDEAAWHAIQSLSKNAVQETAKRLIASRDRQKIESVVQRLVTYSKLSQHAALTAEFLHDIADFIPDNLITSVLDWITPFLDLIPRDWSDARLFEPSWKLIGKLSYRVSSDAAVQLSIKIANHATLQMLNVLRRHLIDAWRCLLQNVAVSQLDQFVATAISLVKENKSDVDFTDSVNLVCQLASSSSTCREMLREALFPEGIEVSNPMLIQAGAFLGWQPKNIDQLNSNATSIASSIKKQVEILGPTEVPSNLGGFGQLSKPTENGKLVVHVGGGEFWLDAMAAHLQSLNDNSVMQLVDAILDMMADDRNIVTNRISLTQELEKFATRLVGGNISRSSSLLERIARGKFNESEIGQTFQEATNPLNPFKMSVGDPLDLRGVALIALSHGSKIHSEWSEQLHGGLLGDLLEVSDDKMRWFAVVAATEADRLTEAEVVSLIISGLDGSTKVRKHVLHGLANLPTVSIDLHGQRLAVRAISRAALEEDAEARAGAAKAAWALIDRRAHDHETESKLRNIINSLSKDVSHFVRFCAVRNCEKAASTA